MRKLKSFMLMAAVAFAIVGCRKPVEVSFGTATQEVSALGDTVEVALKSNGEWTVSSTADWLVVSPTSGTGDATLTLVADANTTGDSRTTEIVANTKDNTATLTVSQNRLEYYLNVTPKNIQCDAEGGEFVISVASNVDWTVTVPNWITSSMASGNGDATLTLTINPIQGEYSVNREVDVVFGSQQVSDKVHVVQSIAVIMAIELDPTSLEFANTGETKTVSVSTEDAWTAEAAANWVSLSLTEGQGDAQVSVTVGENPAYEDRQTTVMFTSASGFQAMLVVKQEASVDPHFLDVTPLAFHFPKEGGQGEITIGCDTDWQIDMSCEWLTLSQTSGTGNATVVLTATANPIAEPRTAGFVIKSGNLSHDFSVSQVAGDQPVEVSFNVDTLFIPASGGMQHLELTSNTAWELEASNWITLLTGPGQGDATIDMAISANASTEGRIGYLSAKHLGVVLATVVVVQEGKVYELEVNPTEFEARAEGGEYTITVSSNQSWSLNVGANWLHCEPMSGFGNKTVTVTVDPSMSLHSRTGIIKVIGESGQDVTVTVEQHP